MQDIFYFLCRGICHQIPERSFIIGHQYLPLCARCTGIYIGVFISFLYLLLRKRWYGNRPPSFGLLCILLFSFFPLIWDGITSYLNIRQTNNTIRIITGVLSGSTWPIFILLIKNYNIYTNNTKPLIKNIFEYIHIISLGCIFSFIIINGYFLSWNILSILLTGSIYLLYVQLFIGILKQIFYQLENQQMKKVYVLAHMMALNWMIMLSFVQKWIIDFL
ncbi:MAG: DUF2085 domain-containing protein [Epulopiscium sp.]|nr:DUF2085 domain-containing protein [Candidatus Epulonipiscium sp.]